MKVVPSLLASEVLGELLTGRQVEAQSQRSRYMRVAQCLADYPFKRAKLYQLMVQGEIRSFVLREKGGVGGMRMIDRLSVDAYLQQKAEEAYAQGETAIGLGRPARQLAAAAKNGKKGNDERKGR